MSIYIGKIIGVRYFLSIAEGMIARIRDIERFHNYYYYFARNVYNIDRRASCKAIPYGESRAGFIGFYCHGV